MANSLRKQIGSHSCICVVAAHFTADHVLYIQELSAHYSPLGYDVHLVVDHLSPEKAAILSTQHNLSINSVTVEECVEKNYKYCVLSEPGKTGYGPVNGWDKSLFMLAHSKPYSNYWLLEDDVLLLNIEGLSEIDNFYAESVDLLIQTLTTPQKIRLERKVHLPYMWEGFAKNPYVIKADGSTGQRLETSGFKKSRDFLRRADWKSLEKMEPFKDVDLSEFCMNWPLSHSMTSAVRFSSNLLDCIKKSVKTHKRLIFQEYIFGTLALHHNLVVKPSFFLKNISHSPGDKIHQIKKLLDGSLTPKEFIVGGGRQLSPLYHPLKGLDNHLKFRSILSKVINSGRVDTVKGYNKEGRDGRLSPFLSYKFSQDV